MKFRKKPVVIEAIQYTGENQKEVESFVRKILPVKIIDLGRDSGNKVLGLEIETLEGVMVAIPNDWIIKGVSGEFYPCKPDIFDKTYESSSTARIHNEDIEKRFTHHRPRGGQSETYTEIREVAKETAYRLISIVPDTQERSLALTTLEEFVYWADEGIAKGHKERI
ncbi:MAG: hypothetical protein AB7S52_11805 [Sphaerochaetaceae bacterium]